ncbi:hypothetical protein V6N11_036649 [Hibiscus sabdariffa]|uniref:Uncharacterized protein n=1 Tax=Hibiscus sabdariffa TaxID=183260 RepID=A0ABR2RBK3_9ROSI
MDHFVQRSCLLACGRPRIRVRFCFRIHSPPLFAAIMNEMITRQQSAQLVLRKHLVREPWRLGKAYGNHCITPIV